MTNNIPKPLIFAGKHRLIEYHILALKHSGVEHIVINRSYLAQKFDEHIGNGKKYGISISYSDEGSQPLETGGGIFKALPLIRTDPFLVVSADIWCQFKFNTLSLSDQFDGCLVLVNNPPHHPNGDFTLNDRRIELPLRTAGEKTFTYSGIGILRKKLFYLMNSSSFPLNLIFKQAISEQALNGVVYAGSWFDVGTQDRLDSVNTHLEAKHSK